MPKTLSFIKEGYFGIVRGIIFSPRSMTLATKMPQLSKKVKMVRANKFLEFCEKNHITYEVYGLKLLKQKR